MAAVSPHYLCLQDAFTRVKAIGLAAVGATPQPNIYCYRLPTDAPDLVTLPAVVVSYGVTETLEDGDFEDQAFGYPVLATIELAANRVLAVPTPDDPVLIWRKLIRDAFLDLAAVALGQEEQGIDCWKVMVEFGPVIDPGYFKEGNVWVSQLTLRYFVTEARNR